MKFDNREDFENWLATATQDELMDAKAEIETELTRIKCDISSEFAKPKKDRDEAWMASAAKAKLAKGRQLQIIQGVISEVKKEANELRDELAKRKPFDRKKTVLITYVVSGETWMSCSRHPAKSAVEDAIEGLPAGVEAILLIQPLDDRDEVVFRKFSGSGNDQRPA
jgi:hypothetical protein